MLAEVYIDESNSHDDAKILCLSGYVYLPNKAKELSAELSLVLNGVGVPFFHMVDCAHGAPPHYDKLTLDQRIDLEKKVIALARNKSEFGFSVALTKEVYDSVAPKSLSMNFGGQYSFCLLQALIHVLNWANESKFDGEFSYFLEAGHASQREANGVLNKIFQFPETREVFKYASHTFGDKEKYLPLQTADLLAWLYANHLKKLNEGKPPRKDFIALVRPDLDTHVTLDAAQLIPTFEFLQARYPDAIYGREFK